MNDRKTNPLAPRSSLNFALEGLEGRRFLSAGGHHAVDITPSRRTSTAVTTTSGSGDLLFDTLPAAVQATMQANAPAGVTITANESIAAPLGVEFVWGIDGYQVTLDYNNTNYSMIVNPSGKLMVLQRDIDFSAAPAVVRAGIQAHVPPGVTISPRDDVTVTTPAVSIPLYTFPHPNGADITYLVDITYGHGNNQKDVSIIVNARGRGSVTRATLLP